MSSTSGSLNLHLQNLCMEMQVVCQSTKHYKVYTSSIRRGPCILLLNLSQSGNKSKSYILQGLRSMVCTSG